MEDNSILGEKESTIICPPQAYILMIPRTLVKRSKSSVGNLEEFLPENLSSPRRRT